jgi:predicted metalloenzyme YecM
MDELIEELENLTIEIELEEEGINELKRLLRKMPEDDKRVRELVERCGQELSSLHNINEKPQDIISNKNKMTYLQLVVDCIN